MPVEVLEKFIEDEKVNGQKAHTLETQLAFLKTVNEFKSLDGPWRKEDVNKFILQISPKYAKSTLEYYKIILRKFFKWQGNSNIVDHLKIKTIKNNLNLDELLNTDDINKLLESTREPRYKALIAFLYESGGRIQEVLSVKVKDIQTTDKGIVISIPQTKTGMDHRRILCVLSGQYILNYIAYAGLKQEDVLFKLHKTNAWRLLVRLGKEAGIKKPCNPHAFRHSQATAMVQSGYNESIIRKKLGWSGDSKMIGRYVHCADSDVIDATAEMNGNATPQARPRTEIKEADKITLVDAAMQFSKLSEENEELKAKIAGLGEMQDKLARLEKVVEVISKVALENPSLLPAMKDFMKD